MSGKRWLSSNYFVKRPVGTTDSARGIIQGIAVATEGEAKGHGIYLDREFITSVVEQGNAMQGGLKARFGHPNMCSTALGTFIGRFKNFRVNHFTNGDGREVAQAVADLFMSNSAKETPNGNLYDYVFSLAESDADMFGTSIVFASDKYFIRGEDGSKTYLDDVDGIASTAGEQSKVYVELEQLHACDAVDDPAANDGLFSSFTRESLAGQITEFLDLHPQVWSALSGNESVIKALSRYSSDLRQFVSKYNEYNGRKHMKEEKLEIADEQIEEAVAAVTEAVAGTVEEHVGAIVEESQEKVDAALKEVAGISEDPESEEEEQAVEEVAPPDEAPSAPDEAMQTSEVALKKKVISEYQSIAAEFGKDIAWEVFQSGGCHADAQKLAVAKLQEENKKLKEKLFSFKSKGGTPSMATSAPEARAKATLFKSNK